MEQLTALDNMFVQQESSRTPMHISPVIVYDQSQVAGGPIRFKEILTVFKRNLYKSKVFRRKLYDPTMGIDLPYWVDDSHFDLEFHVRHIALPAPGDWRQFCIQLARLHARGLDMNRPLWEAYVIEGLDNVEGLAPGSFAILLKIHHSAIDGVSGAEIMTAIHSLTPEREPPLIEDDWQAEKLPAAWKTWRQAYINTAKLPLNFIKTASSLVPNLIKANKLDPHDNKTSKPAAVKTRFNGKVSGHRVTDMVLMDLNEVKAIKNAVAGSTVNDVMVSVVGGGLRKYLAAKEELPTSSMVCGAPISVRPAADRKSAGNQISMMTIKMHTEIDDPIERLQAIHQSATESKAYSSAVGARAMMDVTQSLAPQLLGLGMRAAMFASVRTDMPLPFHVIVSNVPGPQVPLYMAGARVHSTYGLGPVVDNMGLFHAVLSGPGGICINFIACRDMLPDPDFYASCLREAYNELKAAALGNGKATAAPTVRENAGATAKPKPKAKAKAKAKPKTKTKTKTKAKAKAKAKAE